MADDDHVEHLAQIRLFSHLDADERGVLATVVTHRTLAAGDVLFEVGDPGDSLFFVEDGAIELYIKDTTGQKTVLATAGVNECFGELSLLDGGSRTASAVALERTVLGMLDRDDLVALFEKHPAAALDMLTAVGGMARRANALLRGRVSRNPNEAAEVRLTMLDRIADTIAAFSGSMAFLLVNAVWFLVWIGLNTLPGLAQFDPFPFGLLTMIVSLEAIFLSCFVLVSQNRQAVKDHVRSDIEYEVNIKAELEVAELHAKTDKLHADMLERFARLERALGGRPSVR